MTDHHETTQQVTAENVILTPDTTIAAPVSHKGRQGFLPIKTNGFDRIFISVILLVAVHLLWMRFLEQSIPLWVATVLCIGMGVVIFKRG